MLTSQLHSAPVFIVLKKQFADIFNLDDARPTKATGCEGLDDHGQDVEGAAGGGDPVGALGGSGDPPIQSLQES